MVPRKDGYLNFLALQFRQKSDRRKDCFMILAETVLRVCSVLVGRVFLYSTFLILHSSPRLGSAHRIPHSSFHILHSSFFIPHSTFLILHSKFHTPSQCEKPCLKVAKIMAQTCSKRQYFRSF